MTLTTTRSFPVVHSTLAPGALLAEIPLRYGLEAIACRLHAAGVNDVYAVATPSGVYFLKVYRADWRSVPEVRYELDLLRHLQARGVAVAAPVPQLTGETLWSLDAPEGPRAAVLYPRAPGRPFTFPFYHSAPEASAAGAALAALHTAADDFASLHPGRRMDLAYLLDGSLAAIAPFLARRPGDRNYLEGLADRLRLRMAELARAGLGWGVCHGDYHAGNAFLGEHGVAVLFDFDASGECWRVYDMGRYYRETRAGPQGDSVWAAFLGAYRAHRGVRAADLDALATLVALQDLAVLAVRLRGVARAWWDSWWLETSVFDDSLSSLRAWDEAHLAR